MPRRHAPIERFFNDTPAELDRQVTFTVPRGDLLYLLGHVRGAYRYTEKQDAQYLRRHGRAFVPGPGAVSATALARERLGGIERRIAKAAGVASMFTTEVAANHAARKESRNA